MNMSDDVVREAEKIGEEGYSARTLTGFTYRLFLCIGLVMALFHIYFFIYTSKIPKILYGFFCCEIWIITYILWQKTNFFPISVI